MVMETTHRNLEMNNVKPDNTLLLSVNFGVNSSFVCNPVKPVMNLETQFIDPMPQQVKSSGDFILSLRDTGYTVNIKLLHDFTEDLTQGEMLPILFLVKTA